MSTSALSSSSEGVTSVWQRYRQFRSGRANLSKDDLQEASDRFKEAGKDTSRVDALLENYDTIDTNGDGISFDELKTYSKDKKLSGDGDDNRVCEEGESAAGMTADQLGALREKLESEGKSTETLDAVIGDFSAADSDANGKLSRNELKAYAESKGLSMPQGSHKGHRHGGPPPAMSEDELTKLRDSLQADEKSTDALDSALANFSVADSDGDGKLSMDEMQAYAKSQGLSLPEPPAPPSQAADSASSSGQSEAIAADSSEGGASAGNPNTDLLKMFLSRFSVQPDVMSYLSSVVA